MKITSDRDRYDELQAALVSRIATAVREHVRLLLEGRVPADLGEVTKDIVFSVTNILDGSDEEDGSDFPMLTFATNDARNELIVADPGEGSWRRILDARVCTWLAKAITAASSPHTVCARLAKTMRFCLRLSRGVSAYELW